MALDSGTGGVIGAQTADPIAAVSEAASQTAQNIASAVQNGPFVHVSLPQLPAETTEAVSPELHMAQKEFEDDHGSSLGGGHIPGLGNTSTHASSLSDSASPLLGSANDALDHAQSSRGAIPGAQNVFDNAHTALNSAPAALNNVAPSIQQAAAPISSADPTDTINTLLSKGITLPAIPGIEQLFQPFASLLQSFGTGVMGALNPSTLLSQSSQIIQAAMSVGQGALKSVDQVWQGKSANSAQAAGQQTQSQGQDTSQRGFDISKLTDEAAAVVQKGNVQLTAVAQAFAAQATALAPVIVTPPAQATLIASATEHLGTAVGIVNATRGELAGYTGQLSGVVNQLLGQSGAGQQAAQAAESVAQNIAQPVMEQAQSLLSNSSSDSDTSTDDLTSKLGNTSTAGFGGSYSGGGGGSFSGGGGGLSTDGIGTNSGGGAGTSVPGTIANAGNALAAQASAAARAAGLTSSPGFMGGGGAANARNSSDEEHQSTVQPYQSITGDTELAGVLGEIAPDVIGQIHSDEEINGYSADTTL
ncbi:hypothetical protein [Nocardia miyunensis]|uniref:hypothetical protein n=1 Tax=Nocardia miyunensis TaxID=282684 RepID=UPI0008363645|nr:hypothetical protein [Nocardia miyunensis]